MTAKRYIVDGYGSGHRLKVNGEGEIGVSVHEHPPTDEKVTTYPFTQYFTTDGTSSGSSDMLVDGSTTPQEFYIKAQDDKDIFIKMVSIRIADASSVLNKFGNLTALTNGIDWSFTTSLLGEVSLASGIKTNLSFIRIGIDTPQIGATSDAFRADVSGASADTYLIVIDLMRTFGLRWGLRLQKGTRDKMSFIVNDNVSAMDGFDIIGFGAQL